MKKRILFLLPGFNFGGTVFSTLNMISFLKNEYDIFVLPMTYQGAVIENYKIAGINLLPESVALSAMMGMICKESKLWRKFIFVFHKTVRWLCLRLGIDYELYLFKRIARKIERKYDFDFVASCQEGGSTYMASCFLKSKRIAWVRCEYGRYSKQITTRNLAKEQVLYSKIDNIVCVSQTTRDDFVNFFPEIKDRVIAIHNIQDEDVIKDKAKEAITDFPQDMFVIVSVGRIAPPKRFFEIPKIARELLDARCEFKWLIIGDSHASEEYDKLISNIKDYNVQDVVIPIGARLNPYPYIKQARLLVNTSSSEACPRVVIESKIIKTPVICADFRSAREFVISDYDGFVDSLDNLHIHIGNMILNKALYERIKKSCETYEMDNQLIYAQLKRVFS